MMKQVIVMRTDLNMRKGKMVAQGGHAAVMPLFSQEPDDIWIAIHEWKHSGMKKICVGIGSDRELMELTVDAAANEIPFFIVTDRGDTEFHGVPTMTCVSFGPANDAKLDAITGHLKLL